MKLELRRNIAVDLELRARKISEASVEFTVTCEPEEAPVRGNLVVPFSDGTLIKVLEDKVIADLAAGNAWAWCGITIRAQLRHTTLVVDEYLERCSYKDKEDFIATSDDYPVVKKGLIAELQEALERLDGWFFVEEAGG